MIQYSIVQRYSVAKEYIRCNAAYFLYHHYTYIYLIYHHYISASEIVDLTLKIL